MGFIRVLNTTINVIYTFRRQATQEKNVGEGKFLTLQFKKSEQAHWR